MTPPPPVLLVEFNELAPRLIQRFIDDGELPNFRRLRDSSVCYRTDASTEATLEPWVQWPTLHSGIPDTTHGIQHLGEAERLAGKGLVPELTRAGKRVGVLGSMNIPSWPVDGFFMPDPWDADGACQPPALDDYYGFVARAVQENSTNRLDRSQLPRFGAFVLRHGLRLGTVTAILAQLAAERRSPGLAWRRGMVLDALNYDMLRGLVDRHEVDFATFFSNSTAHFQHYFWRNLEPEQFTDPPLDSDDPSLATAILEGYRNMDRLLGRMLQDFPGWRLILATGLSQQPWDTDKALWRPHRVSDVLELAQIDPNRVTIEPVMAEEFIVDFPDAAAADDGERRLLALRAGDGPLLRLQREADRIKLGSAINTWRPPADLMATGPGGIRRFDELFHRIHGIRSGWHHPEGILWIQSERPDPDAGLVPLTAVAPTILSLCDVAYPDYMAEQPLAS